MTGRQESATSLSSVRLQACCCAHRGLTGNHSKLDRMSKALTSTLIRIFDPFLSWAATRYQANVAVELRKYGLRYEDLWDPLLNQDVDEALKRLPQAEVDARNQRLKRAMDLSLKHAYLPKDLQSVQTPYSVYISPTLEQVELENAEKAELGTGKVYDRQLP